jgi:hypothetical protein
MTGKRVWLTVVATVAGVAATWLAIPRMVAGATPPPDNARAPAAVECTLAGTGKSAQGLTNGAPVTTKVAASPTTAFCVDRRADVKNKLTGAIVEVPDMGTLEGNCANLTGSATVRVTWIRATPTTTPSVSTIKVSGGIADGVPYGGAEVTDGPLKGYTVSALPVSAEALTTTKDLLLAACATSAGASQATIAGTVYFNQPA